MQKINLVVLPGDGIGPEVMEHALRVVRWAEKSSGVTLAVETIPCGGKFYLEHGTRDWPEGSEAKCKAADAILLGAVGWPSPSGPGPVTMRDGKMAGYSAVIGNRSKLDLFANVRPVRALPGIKHGISGRFETVWRPEHVDMVIVRENTEGLYAGMGGVLAAGDVRSVATDTRVITRAASERVIRHAFELCKQRKGAPGDGKRRVTCIVKNNVLFGCQLFTEVFAEVGADYPDIAKDVAIVDAFTQWLITRPEFYDVCVTTNMFGDIVTDLASVLQGGMGMAVGCNVGAHHAMFEPIHGSAPPLAGTNTANPMAMIGAAAECLRWVGRRKSIAALEGCADKIEAAIAQVVKAGAPLTADLVGKAEGASTQAVADAICAQLA